MKFSPGTDHYIADDFKYESPIEKILADHLLPHLHSQAEFACQVPCRIMSRQFRLDFTIVRHGFRLNVECDGKEFHDPVVDRWRDALLLGTRNLDTVFRFSGRDLHWHPRICCWLLSIYCPFLFSSRGAAYFRDIACHEVKRLFSGEEDVIVSMLESPRPDPNWDDEEDSHWEWRPQTVKSILRQRSFMPGVRQSWKPLHEFATKQPNRSLSEIMALYDAGP